MWTDAVRKKKVLISLRVAGSAMLCSESLRALNFEPHFCVGEEADFLQCLHLVKPDAVFAQYSTCRLHAAELLNVPGAGGARPLFFVFTDDEVQAHVALAQGFDEAFAMPADFTYAGRKLRERLGLPPQAGTKEEAAVRWFIDAWGINGHSVSMHYLQVALEEMLRDPQLLYSISKQLYPQVAGLCGASAPAVAKGIERMVKSNYERGTRLSQAFPSHPTNAEFFTFALRQMQNSTFKML